MDVRCERCGTSYALDEARLGDGGARVRCARCGHVFLVQRSGERPARPPGTAAGVEPVRREWKVRGRDGSISTLRELTTLQRWIVDRKLGRDDEIGLDGENWKRLGSIADLEPFFAAVEAGARVAVLEAELARLQAAAAVVPPSTPLDSTVAPAPAVRPGPAASGNPAAGVSSIATAASAGPAASGNPAAGVSPTVGGTTAASAGPAASGNPAVSAKRAGTGPSLVEPAFTRGARGLGVAPSDGWEPPRLRRSAGAWLVLVLVLLALLGGGIWAYFQVWLPTQARAREEQARNSQLERDQKDREERQRAAEQRAKQELLQSLAGASLQDAGPVSVPDAGPVPRGALDVAPPGPPGAESRPESGTPARTAVVQPVRPASEQPSSVESAQESGEGAAPAAVPSAERRGPPQTFEDWMAEGHRRRIHERAAAALAAYDRALALRPNRAEAHTGRGLALLDLGRRSDALAEFERALELDPRDGIAVLGIAETYRSLGRSEEARRAYQRYLDGWPGGSEARTARAALESLKE